MQFNYKMFTSLKLIHLTDKIADSVLELYFYDKRSL